MQDRQSPPAADSGADGSTRASRWVLALRILALLAGVLAINLAGAWLVDTLAIDVSPQSGRTLHSMVMISAFAYMMLIAIPFVPGVEIGIALLVLGGPGIALLVYACTVVALLLSFLVGYFLPQAWLISTLHAFGLRRASRLVATIEPLSPEERVGYLTSQAPVRMVPFLLRHRYLALAVAINIPGNALIGGGGGISMIAGCSRLYSPQGFLATLMIAVAPVPLAMMLFGHRILS